MISQTSTVAEVARHFAISGPIRPKTGFSLLELLIVIGIIAIIAAILFPVFMAAREKARQSQCASNLSQIGLAVLQYVQDYDEIYPTSALAESSCNASANGQIHAGCSPAGGTPIPVMLSPYIKNTAIWKCPDSTDRDGMLYDYGYAEYLAQLPQLTRRMFDS